MYSIYIYYNANKHTLIDPEVNMRPCKFILDVMIKRKNKAKKGDIVRVCLHTLCWIPSNSLIKCVQMKDY